MKKTALIVFILFAVFLILILPTGMYKTLVGMASTTFQSEVTYTCVDNDDSATNPLTSKGTVTVSSSKGKRVHYTDYCLDEETLKEYYCDQKTNRQTYLDRNCTKLNLTCSKGRCN